ncbi:MAG TPA: GDSL-type esterase/lipase family protein [Candidatus Angelobacter sp.]|nr:GDSL-type esterase/lipase family protein [Candidatus Angelobacter sp.]
MDQTVPPDPVEHAAPGRRRVLRTVAGVAAGVLVLATVGAAALARLGTDASAAGAPAASVQPSGAGLTPAAAEPPDATSTDTPPPLPPAQPTLVLGDSLGLVVYPWLADLLPDRYVSYEAVVGRSTPATETRLGLLNAVPPVVIVSSGTNDPVANVFEESARRILDRLGPARCVVWVDVVRPDRIGDSQTAMNAALDRAASGRPNVRVLRWSEMVASHPEWMSGDGIHPNEAGAQARAQAFADAARGCSALDPSAPRAKREYLAQSAFWGPVSGQYRAPSAGTPYVGTTTPSGSVTGSTSGSGSGTATATTDPGSTSATPSTPPTGVTASPTAPSTPAAVSASSTPPPPATTPGAPTGAAGG